MKDKKQFFQELQITTEQRNVKEIWDQDLLTDTKAVLLIPNDQYSNKKNGIDLLHVMNMGEDAAPKFSLVQESNDAKKGKVLTQYATDLMKATLDMILKYPDKIFIFLTGYLDKSLKTVHLPGAASFTTNLKGMLKVNEVQDDNIFYATPAINQKHFVWGDDATKNYYKAMASKLTFDGKSTGTPFCGNHAFFIPYTNASKGIIPRNLVRRKNIDLAGKYIFFGLHEMQSIQVNEFKKLAESFERQGAIVCVLHQPLFDMDLSPYRTLPQKNKFADSILKVVK